MREVGAIKKNIAQSKKPTSSIRNKESEKGMVLDKKIKGSLDSRKGRSGFVIASIS